MWRTRKNQKGKEKVGNDSMGKRFRWIMVLCCLALLSACGEQQELADMKSLIIDDKRAVIWEERVYIPFCVVSKSDCGALIGYVDGDTDDRISEFKGFLPEEWVVGWMPMDGGAILMKEENVVDIPDGLVQEY